ncbi:Protein SYM1 [Pseudocercospora fuligena]|uniref:Protein SYM1 n=1 Tax=Pseudocercospora fuligena TaxID=685502 RepID=A0A8H6RQ92_9PEZI|nr:Protein SYM1 [Pseudocercospora fuligena]
MPSPIVTASLQAGVLSAISNVLAQLITCHQAGITYTLNIVELLQFVIYSVLSCPPNYLWQAFLEAQFPAYARELPQSEKELIVDEIVHSSGTEKDQGANGSLSNRRLEEKAMTHQTDSTVSDGKTKKLSLRNTAIKFTLDQTLGAAVNTVLFIAGIALLRGQPWSTVYTNIHEQFWPMTFAGQKLWPAVSILSFVVIPLEHRMLFGSVAGLFWGIYLSLVSGSGKH